MAEFRHPQRPQASGTSLHSLTAAILAPLGGLAFFAVMIVVFGAQVVTCFRPTRTTDGAEVTPRALNVDDSAEVALARPLSALWVKTGNDVDSLVIGYVESDEINAASFGAGRFLVWRGLRQLSLEAQVAVAAHELAHDMLRHSERAAELRDVTDFVGNVVATIGQAGSEQQTLQRWSANLVIPRYSREQELAADERAVDILREVGLSDPAGSLCDTFRQLRATVRDDHGGFFASHPALTDRIARLRKSSASPSPRC